MAAKEGDFSAFVSKTLHSIGYKWDLIQLRRDLWRHSGNGNNLLKDGISQIFAGSRREGVGKMFKSDMDCMNVINEVIAAENIRPFEHKGNLTVLQLDLNDCPPGYSCLVVKKHGGRFKNRLGHIKARVELRLLICNSCCISYSGKSCLSSEIFIDKIYDYMLVNGDLVRAGPSLKIDYFCPVIRVPCPQDNVISLPCHCPSIFEIFRRRPRRYGWPSEDSLHELSQLEAHVVPVGHRQSADHFLQWRICFTMAEIRLIESLTEPQIQVFILLKIFAKEVLKEVWDAMTSYIMKNLILWTVELTPRDTFRTDTIVDGFLTCLVFLRLCVRAGKLPSYMISERNLLSHDQFIVKRQALRSFLDDCIREKGACLFRSDTLKKAMTKMYRSPQSTVEDGLERDKMERVFLSFTKRTAIPILHNCENSVQSVIRVALSVHMDDDLARLFLDMFTKNKLRIGRSKPVSDLPLEFAIKLIQEIRK